MINVGLQVPLRQVGPLASRHDAAHIKGAAQALFNALHRVRAVVHGEAERGHRNQMNV